LAFLDKLNDFARNIVDKLTDAIESVKLKHIINAEKTETVECLR